MAQHNLIRLYLAELADSLRWHGDADDVVAETEDHLRCSVDRRVASGVDAEEAQRETLECFGDPVVVARAFASTRSGRLALPTRSTKSASILAIICGAFWIALPFVLITGWWLYDRLDSGGGAPDDLGSPAQLGVVALIAMTHLAAFGTLLGTMLSLNERHGGFGLPGIIGMGATGLGCAAALFGWFYMGWGSLLIVGTLLVSVELWSKGLSPKGAVLAVGAGPAIGGMSWGVLRYLQVGSVDEYGDYAVATVAGIVIGSTILAVGLIGLGQWLRGEEPIELGAPALVVRS